MKTKAQASLWKKENIHYEGYYDITIMKITWMEPPEYMIDKSHLNQYNIHFKAIYIELNEQAIAIKRKERKNNIYKI